MSGDIAVYDHLRSTDPDDDDAIYRVVGTRAGSVTLLRVSGDDGRRVHTGEVFTVPADALDSFEPAENPDGNQSLGASLTDTVEGAYWSLRSVLKTLAASPAKTLGALVFFVVGRFGGDAVPLPDGVLAVLAFVGLLMLAAVGTGRI